MLKEDYECHKAPVGQVLTLSKSPVASSKLLPQVAAHVNHVREMTGLKSPGASLNTSGFALPGAPLVQSCHRE